MLPREGSNVDRTELYNEHTITATRLRTRHLFLWAALAAIHLTLLDYAGLQSPRLGWHQPMPRLLTVSWIASGLTLTGQITIALIIGCWWWQKKVSVIQPGEWLAIFAATAYVLMLISWL